MSIDTKQLVHIAIETTVISVLFVFFYNKNRVLCEQIDELETVVSQQQETLQKHEAMILNLSNSIKLLKNTQYHKYDTESSSDSDNEPEPVIILKPLVSSIQVDQIESDGEEQQEPVTLPIDKNRVETASTKSEKKKKKKKKKKVEQTEQMLDNELLEELKDLQ